MVDGAPRAPASAACRLPGAPDEEAYEGRALALGMHIPGGAGGRVGWLKFELRWLEGGVLRRARCAPVDARRQLSLSPPSFPFFPGASTLYAVLGLLQLAAALLAIIAPYKVGGGRRAWDGQPRGRRLCCALHLCLSARPFLRCATDSAPRRLPLVRRPCRRRRSSSGTCTCRTTTRTSVGGVGAGGHAGPLGWSGLGCVPQSV